MKKFIAFLMLAVAVASCSKVPVTNRKQSHLMPESKLIEMAKVQFQMVMDSANVLPDTDPRAARVKRVGINLQTATEKYLNDKGFSKRIQGFEWDFKTIEDPSINAWAMPGGKIAFYTGIMDLFENDDQLAVVMGHEIAHAIARHGNERMSQQLGVQVALSVLAGKSGGERQQFLQFMGVGSQLGTLAFSRKHELEADKIGLVIMKLAGYDPAKSVAFWEKMAAQGGSIPEFMSTHPSDERRIAEIKEFLKIIDQYTE